MAFDWKRNERLVYTIFGDQSYENVGKRLTGSIVHLHAIRNQRLDTIFGVPIVLVHMAKDFWDHSEH